MNDQLHILLVDDNPEDRALVIRELRRDFPNLQINQITDANQFARALESDKGDLVITDYQLRWSDGLAVLRAIKARWPDCPVIMFTGTGSEEVAVEAMKAGLDDYVLKTANQYARLPGAVQRAVERKKQSRALKEADLDLVSGGFGFWDAVGVAAGGIAMGAAKAYAAAITDTGI